MEKFLKIFYSLIILAVLLTANDFSLAQTNFEETTGLKNTGGAIGYNIKQGSGDIPKIVGTIAYAIISLIGVAFMVLVLMGAFDIQGAGGNEETLKKGKDKIKNGAVGMAIVFSAYLLTYAFLKFIVGKLFRIE